MPIVPTPAETIHEELQRAMSSAFIEVSTETKQLYLFPNDFEVLDAILKAHQGAYQKMYKATYECMVMGKFP